MQFYIYDRVKVKEGVKDEEDRDLSGLEGRICNIGYRDEKYPLKVEIHNEDTGFCDEYNFSSEEVELSL